MGRAGVAAGKPARTICPACKERLSFPTPQEQTLADADAKPLRIA